MHRIAPSPSKAADKKSPLRQWQPPKVTPLGMLAQLTASGSGAMLESELGQTCVMFPQFVQCMARRP